MDALASSLSELASTAFRWSAIAFALVNGAAALLVWLTRDRRLVNRVMSPLLAVNLLLLGTGAGVPVLAYSMKVVVNAVSSTSTTPAAQLEASADRE